MSPDYLLVTEGTTIVSRWFVLESKWIRKNQIVVTLRRDLVIDFFEEYKNAPFFCEKGLPSGMFDPYIFNSEGLEFNQIKANQTYIFDRSGRRKWIVLYVDKNIGKELTSTETDYKIIRNVKTIQGNYNSIVLPIRNPSERRHTTDAPYDIWVIPPEWPYQFINQNGDVIELSEQESLASEIATALGESCFDVQMLPFCPLGYNDSWSVTSSAITEGSDAPDGTYMRLMITSITTGQITYDPYNAVVICGQTSKFSFTYNYLYPRALGNVEERKIDGATRFVRMCAPMMGQAFEFNAAKIGVTSTNPYITFTINATYKPIRPEIHIFPHFGELYGPTFDLEYRGMRCGSDFSMPRLTSAWVTYENNNKNYLNSFNREIEHIEVTNNIALASRAITSVADVGAAMAGGAAVGSIFGPAGTAIGAAIGGITSAIGAGADVAMNQLSINETIDYTKDQFGYSIQSIKARPNTLARTSAFEIDSILWPFIELYESTTQEVEALKKKLEFNGFTIGRIGTFAEFVNYARDVYTSFDTKYIKGKLIRNGTMSDDFHIVNELAMELYKGVYSYL